MRPSLRISEDHKRLMRSVRFGKKQVGIEWTTIPPALFNGGDYCDEKYGEDLFRDFMDDGLVDNVLNDPGCIEIPSKILKGWKEVIYFYTLVMERAAMHKCKQWSPHHTGGGGHIHISSRSWSTTEDRSDYDYGLADISRERTEEITQYLRHRPYIAWAFNHPDDNITAVVRESDGFNTTGAIRDSYDNVEFRFFDGARNINQQIEHVAFALKLLSVKHDRGLTNIYRPRKMPLAEALKGWRETVESFGLPYNLYQKYSKNIRTRYGYGCRYLN